MKPFPLAVITAVAAIGCASARSGAVANRTFYQDEEKAPPPGELRVERPYVPLDGPGGFVGVSVLDDTVRLSRPRTWHVLRAGLTSDARFVQYVSPEGYLFAIYERSESPGESWREIRELYEADTKRRGNEVVAEDIPVAIHGAQGRKFLLRRSVKGRREPYVNVSWEILVRGKHHIELLQVVREDEGGPPVDQDLLRVAESLQLL